jgi:hypothetical protein
MESSMQNSDIVKMLLCAMALSFTGYAAYLSRRIKALDRRIEARTQALESSKALANPSPAE